MRSVEEMARERAELQQALWGIAMWNTHGQTIEKLAEVGALQIAKQRRLVEVEREIQEYINA
jgi:hypothetical protein